MHPLTPLANSAFERTVGYEYIKDQTESSKEDAVIYSLYSSIITQNMPLLNDSINTISTWDANRAIVYLTEAKKLAALPSHVVSVYSPSTLNPQSALKTVYEKVAVLVENLIGFRKTKAEAIKELIDVAETIKQLIDVRLKAIEFQRVLVNAAFERAVGYKYVENDLTKWSSIRKEDKVIYSLFLNVFTRNRTLLEKAVDIIFEWDNKYTIHYLEEAKKLASTLRDTSAGNKVEALEWKFIKNFIDIQLSHKKNLHDIDKKYEKYQYLRNIIGYLILKFYLQAGLLNGIYALPLGSKGLEIVKSVTLGSFACLGFFHCFRNLYKKHTSREAYGSNLLLTAITGWSIFSQYYGLKTAINNFALWQGDVLKPITEPLVCQQTDKPIAQIIWPEHDWNRVLKPSVLKEQVEQLQTKYCVRLDTVGNGAELSNALVRTSQITKKAIDLLYIHGHGDQHLISFGYDSRGLMDKTNPDLFNANSSLNLLSPDASIVLLSCSNGKPLEGENNLAETFANHAIGRKVIAGTDIVWGTKFYSLDPLNVQVYNEVFPEQSPYHNRVVYIGYFLSSDITRSVMDWILPLNQTKDFNISKTFQVLNRTA